MTILNLTWPGTIARRLVLVANGATVVEEEDVAPALT